MQVACLVTRHYKTGVWAYSFWLLTNSNAYYSKTQQVYVLGGGKSLFRCRTSRYEEVIKNLFLITGERQISYASVVTRCSLPYANLERWVFFRIIIFGGLRVFIVNMVFAVFVVHSSHMFGIPENMRYGIGNGRI